MADRLDVYRDRMPLKDDVALLRLVFGPEFNSDAFGQWALGVELDEIGGQHLRLLPELGLRLGRETFHHPLRPRIAGIQRRTLFANRILLHRGVALWRRLAESLSADGMVLGAAARFLRGDETGLAKPFASFDLLLPETIDREKLSDMLRSSFAIVRPALGGFRIEDSDGFRYRLFLHVEPVEGEELRRRSIAVLHEETWLRVLSIEDELFQALWCGMDARLDPERAWVPDALGLVTGREPIEWTSLVGIARRHGAAEPTGAALALLASLIPSPQAMVAAQNALLRSGEPWGDRLAMRLRARPRAGVIGLTVRLILIYRGQARRAGRAAGFRGFLAFLGERWGTSTLRETVVAASARLRRHGGAARRRRPVP